MICCCSVAQSCPALCDPMDGSPERQEMSSTISRSSLRLIYLESVMPSNHLILCRPLLLPPSVFPSIRVFSNESVIHIRWPKYYSFCIIPSNEHSRLISFRIDSLIFLLSKGLSRVFSSTRDPKALILWHSTFFVVQLSHPYMTTGKTITQTRWTFSTV